MGVLFPCKSGDAHETRAARMWRANGARATARLGLTIFFCAHEKAAADMSPATAFEWTGTLQIQTASFRERKVGAIASLCTAMALPV